MKTQKQMRQHGLSDSRAELFNRKGLYGKMKVVLALLAVLAVVALSSPINANAQTQTMSIDDAVEYALKNNRDINIAQLEVKRAHAAVREAYGYALPTVSASASYSRFLEKMKMPFPDFGALLNNSTYDIIFNEGLKPRDDSKFLPMETVLQSFALTNNYEAKVEVSQVLFNSAVFEGIGSSGVYLELSKSALRSQIGKTVNNVKQSFYTALLMKEMYEVIKQSYQTFEKSVNNIRLAYEEGLASEFDYLQLKVQLENFKPKVLEAENGMKLTIEALKLSMSMDKSTQIDIKGNYEDTEVTIPEEQSTINSALESNLDLQTLVLKKKIDLAFVNISRSDYYPTLVAFGNYTLSGAADDFKFKNYSSAMVGLSFTVNLFSGGRTANKVEQQLFETDKTEEQIRTLKDAIAMQVKSTILNYKTYSENISATVENVKLADRAYNIAELRLREGTGTQLELIMAEQAKREAILNKYKAINDYYIAKSQLDNLLGKLEQSYLKFYEEDLK